MKINVENFMGCEKADVEVAKVTYICGLNHQGKTSFINAVSAALTGTPVILGLRKTDLGMLVRTGTAAAKVKIENEDSAVAITYPKAEMQTTGSNPPSVSKIAAGVDNIVDFSAKERSEYIRNITGCAPTKNDLKAFLKERYIENEKIADKVWEKIDQDGFDASLERAKDTGRALKQQWSIVTGETYGSQKAETWQPAGWTSDLIDTSEESQQANITGLQAELEDLISRQAIDENLLNNLKSEVSDEIVDNLTKQRDVALKTLTAARDNMLEISQKLDRFPNFNADEKQICPHCGGNLCIVHGRIVEYNGLDDSSKEKINEQREELKKEYEKIKLDVDDLEKAYNKIFSECHEAEEKLKQLNELQSKSGGNVTERDIDLKREELRKANEGLTAFKAAKEAQRLANNIKENQVIIDALDMSGIRKNSTLRGLSIFNSSLDAICKDAAWGKVSVDNDLTILMNDRPYVLLSESEKFRCNVTLQLAIADYNKDTTVVIDGAELLDLHGKNGLLKVLLNQNEFNAIIGMMLPNKEKAPKNAAHGIKSYWVENGIFREV
ncbi:MAG: hypothetical protein IJ077_08665 [Eubacterium sp.]|nr:hypothetical protein [Alphaproteobacteria bacterium]MBQ8981665.1 hypothetical protein [Eubacterium sp.]